VLIGNKYLLRVCAWNGEEETTMTILLMKKSNTEKYGVENMKKAEPAKRTPENANHKII